MRQTMNVFSKGFFLFAIAATSMCHAEIRTADNLEPIANEFECSDKETLVLLDIGGTILAFCDPILHKSHENWTKEWFKTNYPNITKDETITLVRIVEQAHESWRLTDPLWQETIAKAQVEGAKVVAFTKILGFKAKRSERLAAFGVIINDDLPELPSGSLYEYSKGIVETEHSLKGPVLNEMLQKMAAKPKKIIFVDDRIDQIQSVEDTCKKRYDQKLCLK